MDVGQGFARRSEPSHSVTETDVPSLTVYRDLAPLGQINQLAINRLSLTVPSTLIEADAPTTSLSLLDLRTRLLDTATPGEIRDRAWRYVGDRACNEKGDWNLFALGLAYPGLLVRASRLTSGLDYHRAAQVQFRIAEEFLFALHRLDLDAPNLPSRLIGAVYDQASGRKKRVVPVIGHLDEDAEPRWYVATSPQSQDGPYRVLERLVRATRNAKEGERITKTQATLIARTYLDGETLRKVAAELMMSESNASKHRSRAKTLIAYRLGRPDLAAGCDP